METISTHVPSKICSKKYPSSIWVKSEGIQIRSGRSWHFSKRVQVLFIQVCLDHFSFYAICWMLNAFLVRYYKCALLKPE